MTVQSRRPHLSELSFALELKKELQQRMVQSAKTSEEEELSKLIEELKGIVLTVRKHTE